MSIAISKKTSKNKRKCYYYFEWGKEAGQRMSTGIFTYTKPKDLIEKNHNKEAVRILETKRSQLILDAQSVGSGYVPQHKLQSNFLDYYKSFIKKNKRAGNRHLENSLSAFTDFLESSFISASDITETLCEEFRTYLLDKYNGETPANYFHRFKRVVKAAAKAGYFRSNPADMVKAKSNRNIRIKDILEVEEYRKLLATPCKNYEVQKAFVFCLYTGIRWVDVKAFTWAQVNDEQESFSFTQSKTDVPLERPLHPVARNILGVRKKGLLFQLPTADGANKVLQGWCRSAGLNKHITWHCARHSFSVLLQDRGIDTATVAGMLGHTSTKYVHKTYQRYKQKNAKEAILLLPQ